MFCFYMQLSGSRDPTSKHDDGGDGDGDVDGDVDDVTDVDVDDC